MYLVKLDVQKFCEYTIIDKNFQTLVHNFTSYGLAIWHEIKMLSTSTECKQVALFLRIKGFQSIYNNLTCPRKLYKLQLKKNYHNSETRQAFVTFFHWFECDRYRNSLGFWTKRYWFTVFKLWMSGYEIYGLQNLELFFKKILNYTMIWLANAAFI